VKARPSFYYSCLNDYHSKESDVRISDWSQSLTTFLPHSMWEKTIDTNGTSLYFTHKKAMSYQWQSHLCGNGTGKIRRPDIYFKKFISMKSVIVLGSLISKQGTSTASFTSEATAIRLSSLVLISSRLSSERNTSIFG
jgi:hypothetical protein